MCQFKFITSSCVNEKLLPLRQLSEQHAMIFLIPEGFQITPKNEKKGRGKKTDILYRVLQRKKKAYTSEKFLYHFSINPCRHLKT